MGVGQTPRAAGPAHMNLHIAPEEIQADDAPVWPRRFRSASFLVLLGSLAWAPFPLGSNREWSWSVLTILVGISWVFWCSWAMVSLPTQRANIRKLAVPAICAGLTLLWAVVQVSPFVPQSWIHPIWPQAASLLGRPLPGSISINPWRTISELSKLLTDLAVVWLTFSLTRNNRRAGVLLNTIIFVGASYALYGFILGVIGITQYALYYPEPALSMLPAGPFVLHNSFATYEGLASLAAVARFVEKARSAILIDKGYRRWALTTMQFALGSGAPYLLANILCVSALVSAASRGGAFAAFCGFCAMGAISVLLTKRGTRLRWMLLGAVGIVVPMLILFWISGGVLSSRTEDLLDAGSTDAMRSALRAAATRMISSAPLLGLGLGTFDDAYPMYASQMFPYVMDAAHCDYLEFAAGIGLPAAACWWAAMLWSTIRLFKGALTRRKDVIFSVIALGATVLVAVHSTVDFSLQIPAVAMVYACVVGLGLAQSYSARSAT
jgi:O-antigen ligase